MNISKTLIPKMDRWYDDAIRNDRREPNVIHRPIEKDLYAKTVDRFSTNFDRLSQMDQSDLDSNPEPGQVEITGEDGQVESLGRAPHGFAMILADREFQEDGPDAYCKETQTKFMVNKDLSTLTVIETEDVFYSPFEPRQHWGTYETANFTLNLKDESVSMGQSMAYNQAAG